MLKKEHVEKGVSGIYKITNHASSKCYVGQSRDIYARWRDHLNRLRKGKHNNDYLQKSWNAHIESDFSFIVLEMCDISILDDLEEKYIKKYDSANPKYGYNLTTGGKNFDYSVSSKKIKNLWIVLQFTLGDKFIKRHNSVREANKMYGKHPGTGMISSVCSGSKPSAYGYIWKWEKNVLNAHLLVENKEFSLEKYPLNPNGKIILQFTLDNKFIKRYKSSYQASKLYNSKIQPSQIKLVCDGEQKQAMGYVWRYEETFDGASNLVDSDEFSIIEYPLVKYRNSVIQLSKDSKIINKFETCQQAERVVNPKDNGKENNNISRCCRVDLPEVKTAYDFIWIYEKDFIEQEFDKNSSKLKEYVRSIFERSRLSVLKCNRETGEVIKKYDSTIHAEEDGYRSGSINQACCGTAKTYKNFIWIHERDYLKNNGLDLSKYRKDTDKMVAKCDRVAGEIINVYLTMSEPESEGFHQSAISMVCLGNRETHGGYMWKTITEEEYQEFKKI